LLAKSLGIHKTKTFLSRSRPKPKLFSSRRLETKRTTCLRVLRTTSLIFIFRKFNEFRRHGTYWWNFGSTMRSSFELQCLVDRV